MIDVLNGRELSSKIKKRLQERIESNISRGMLKPSLDIIQVGKEYATTLYIGMKRKIGEEIGVNVTVHQFEEGVETKELIGKINEIENQTNGILVQLPLPEQIDTKKVLDSIPLNLDVDGLNSGNLEKLRRNEEDAVSSATALGVINLLKDREIELKGRKVCMIGNSVEVGQPLAAMFRNNESIVEICDIYTPNTQEISKRSDIVAVAVGKPGLVNREWVKNGAVVIDIGVNRVGDKILGDVVFEDVKDIVSYISPVPGGVGPMTVVSLFSNLVWLWERKQ